MRFKTKRIGQWFPIAALALSFVAISPVPSRCHASEHEAAHGHEEGEAAEEEVIDDGDDTHAHGIELGEFEVRTSRAVPPQKNRVRFKIYATAKGERYRTLRELMESRKNKVRDQVIVATRLVQVESYDDPELLGLRRRVLLRLRRALPELPIDDIYISDFSISVESST